MSQGFIYYSYGHPFIDETFISIKSLLKHNPEAHITLFTDQPSKEYIKKTYSDVPMDAVHELEVDHSQGYWTFRTHLYRLSPYEKTLFLDGDTFITAPLMEIFDLLHVFDVAAVPDFFPGRGYISGLKGGFRALNYYNCGVLLFKKCDAMKNLFNMWEAEYAKYSPIDPHDQSAFVRALVKIPVRFITLPTEYNVRLIGHCVSFQGRTKILHGRIKNIKAVLARINRIDFVINGSRTWIPNFQIFLKASSFKWIYYLLKYMGLTITARGQHDEKRRGIIDDFHLLFKTLIVKSRKNIVSTIDQLDSHQKNVSEWLGSDKIIWLDERRNSTLKKRKEAAMKCLQSKNRYIVLVLNAKEEDWPWAQWFSDSNYYLEPDLTLELRNRFLKGIHSFVYTSDYKFKSPSTADGHHPSSFLRSGNVSIPLSQ